MRSLILLLSACLLVACSNLVVNNKYAKDANTIPTLRMPAGQKAAGVKALYPVPAATAAGKKMPNIYPPG